jgi:uncharacterized protein (DUF2252 family)
MQRLTPTERQDFGRRARKQVPRREHAAFSARRRKHDPLDLLRGSNAGRIPPLVDLKSQRMASSPFGFFRGAVAVMAADLADYPHSGVINQICGDAHVRNLGAYADSAGQIVFDINDFDETIRGPFEWDVKRLATSLILAGRELHAKDSVVNEATLSFLSRYRKTMRSLSNLPITGLAHYQVRLDSIQPISDILAHAQRATPLVSLQQLTDPASSRDGKSRHPARESGYSAHPKITKPRERPAANFVTQLGQARQFRSEPPLLERITGRLAETILGSLKPYAQTLEPQRRHFLAHYRPIDVAFKVVGTGSVGLRDYCIYMEGNGSADPIFLQIKEEVASAYTAYLPQGSSPRAHNGHRVVDGTRAMQFESDPFLGYTTISGRDYLVRQLNDHKASLNFEQDPKELRSQGLVSYADLCGQMLARGHARSGDPLVLTSYLGKSCVFDDAIIQFARSYAQQTERDWKKLTRSLKKTPAVNQ